MRISVRSYRRIERADIDLAPIALVAGHNGAGKTSLYQAAVAALTRHTTPMGIAKKDAAALVARGSDLGSVRVATATGHTAISWPACKGETDGTAPPSSSAFAAGAACILDMKDDDRARALGGYVNSIPTVTDLYTAMNDVGYSDDAARKIWEKVEGEGWDAIHGKTVENGAKLKGQWEAVTSERYGSAKAGDWKPAGWSAELANADLSSIEREISEAKAALEGTIATTAVSAAELERLRTEAVGNAPGALERMQRAVEGAQETVTAAEEERAALPAADNDAGIPCPSCGTHLIVDKAWKGPTALKLAETITESDLKLRREARAAADGKCERLRGILTTQRNGLNNLENAERTAEAAKAKLAEIAIADAQSGQQAPDEVAGRRAALADAEAAHKALSSKLNADRIHAAIGKNVTLIEILAPDGLRRKKLAAGLDDFNGRLEKLSAAAKWPAVWIDETLNAFYGTEPYWNCSESQQMRTRITLQVAMALGDQSEAVLIDRADQLDQKGRNGLFMLLKHAGLKALVLMTINAPDKVPALAKAGLGHSYWLDGGSVAEIGQAETKAAA